LLTEIVSYYSERIYRIDKATKLTILVFVHFRLQYGRKNIREIEELNICYRRIGLL